MSSDLNKRETDKHKIRKKVTVKDSHVSVRTHNLKAIFKKRPLIFQSN